MINAVLDMAEFYYTHPGKEPLTVTDELIKKIPADYIKILLPPLLDIIGNKKPLPPMRYLSPEERRFFTTDGYLFLTRLQIVGLIDSEIIEMLLARATFQDISPMSKKDVEKLVDYIFLNRKAYGSEMLFRFIAYNSDETLVSPN